MNLFLTIQNIGPGFRGGVCGALGVSRYISQFEYAELKMLALNQINNEESGQTPWIMFESWLSTTSTGDPNNLCRVQHSH